MKLPRASEQGIPKQASDRIRFSHDFRGFFTLVNPFPVNANLPVAAIYTVPANVAGGLITAFTVKGSPAGIWYSGIAWSLRLSRGAVQEFIPTSNAGTQSPQTADGGARWVPYGSMREPFPVAIKIAPSQELSLAIVSYPVIVGTASILVNFYGRIEGEYSFGQEGIA